MMPVLVKLLRSTVRLATLGVALLLSGALAYAIHRANNPSPCPSSCHARARLADGKALLNENGDPLLFETRADAERYARAYAAPSAEGD